MTKLYQSLEKTANNIAKKDIIFLYPKKNKKAVKDIIKEGDKTNKLYESLIKKTGKTGYTCPETEWVFDHFYLVQQKWSDLKNSFDVKNFLSLPQIGSGPLKGYPRIYNLIVQLLLISNNKINSKQLIHFLNGYQKHNPLLIGELNALPQIITLEITLNFKKKIEEIIEKTDQVNRADKMFSNLFIENEGDLRKCLTYLKKEIDLSEKYYIERLWQRLEGDKIYHRLIKKWLQSHLHANKKDISFILNEIKKEHNLSEKFFANTINALKWLPNVNWTNLIEKVSIVEKILSKDPAKAYGNMDEKGKNLYQKKIQTIAKKFKVKEVNIAKTTISLALAYKKHIGYFLIKENYQDLEKAFRYQKNFLEKIKDFIIKRKTICYFVPLFLLTFLFTFSFSYFFSFSSSFLVIIVFLLSLEAAIILFNHLILSIIPSNTPVRFFYKKIPKENKTVVAINCVLTNKERIDFVVKNLEINYLNSKDENIFYTLLFGFKDSDSKEEGEDKKLLNYAQKKVNKLNKKYGNKFSLLCRTRQWNPVEKKFMEWERKRGKLLEFNKLLLGSKKTSFFTPLSENLKNIKYVITLDEDNIMPKETAKLLIGTLAHPLNKPVLNKEKKIVDGYSIIQPRIGTGLSCSQASLFSKIFSQASTIDPHSHALSDIYQDFFGSGSFVGKGIYELETYTQALAGKIPENTVLSHDLLEGFYAKTGLSSDLLIFEDFPSYFSIYLYRMHRWVRGDWQIINWLWPKVKNASGKKEKNPLSFLEKWKIFDNLRRSLLSLVFILGLLTSIYLKSLPLFLYTLLTLSLPFVLPVFAYTFRQHKNVPLLNVCLKLKRNICNSISRSFCRLLFLVSHCYIELLAIFQALVRKFIIKKKLLEWQSYQELVNTFKGSFLEIFQITFIPFIFAFILFFTKNPLFYPFAFLWSLAPFAGFLISLPIKEQKTKDSLILRSWALRAWNYYQKFVTEETNFLPPDNIQKNKVYYYTSPTNIGTYLLSIVSAKSFNYITPVEFIDKVDQCLNSIERLEKKQGHLYNWYNIKSLEAVKNKYLSSVDSGNFIASLFVLKKSLEKNDGRINTQGIQESIKDHLLIVKETALEKKKKTKLIKEINKYLEKESIIKLPALEVLLSDFETSIFDEDLLFWIRVTKERINLFTKKSSYKIDQELVKKNLQRIEKIINNINFRFLYNREKNLFQIGYNDITKKQDDASYDLMGSEANIASFLSIALNQIGQTHWKKLDRTMIKTPILLSWGGSLFETINNLIFFKLKPESLLYENGKKIIKKQIKYAKKLKIPWGMSEAAHFASETSDEIHYRVFGVPSIGIKRDLINYKVVSPYSSFLSLPFTPKKVTANLKKIKSLGGFGRFGFYDSIDFTNQKRVIPSYYAHHLGFSLASICNYLKKGEIRNLFSENSQISAIQYLLEEPYLIDSKIAPLPKKEKYKEPRVETAGLPIKEFIPLKTELPQSMFLSNGKLFATVSNNGAFSLFTKDTLITPFSRMENKKQGWQIFLKENNKKWPIAPSSGKVKYRVAFHENLAEFNARFNNIEAQTEITISPHENLEIRKVTLSNNSNRIKKIELQTEGQICLAKKEKELSSPYFHRLFLRLGILLKKKAWFVKRAHLFPDDENIKFVHWISSPKKRVRISFAKKVFKKAWYSENPEFGNNVKLRLKPKEKTTFYCFCGIVTSKQRLKALVKKYNKNKYCNEIFENIHNQESRYLQSLNIDYIKAKKYCKLGSQIFWRDPRINPNAFFGSTKIRNFLWQFGISGDLPIILLAIKDEQDLPLVRDFVRAVSYLKFKGLKLDLIILNKEEKSYVEPLREWTENLLQDSENTYLISQGDLTKEELISLKNIAIGSFPLEEVSIKKEQFNQEASVCNCPKKENEIEKLSFFNQYGGFSKNKEYVILANKKKKPDLPWSNIIANKKFGCIVSHYGLGATWYLNSQQNRITSWGFSPIKNQVSELFYLKEKDCLWSLTLSPLPNNNDYKIIHGKGYSEFENKNHNIKTNLKVFVHPNRSCKFYQLTIENKSNKEKEISLINFFPLVLGDFEELQSPLKLKKERDLFLAEQTLENNVGQTKVGIFSSEKISSFSFYQPNVFSKNNELLIPSALEKEKEKQINSYPCINLINKLTIPPKERKQVLILMAADPEEEKIKEIIKEAQKETDIFEEQKYLWEKTLSKIKIKTPSSDLDILFNHWLLYQTMASRILGKTGAYQQGGAFGFRDQSQDLLAILPTNPKKVREMLIYFAGKQFEEGDVLNWWHEPEGLGSRTLVSDAHLWLPYLLSCYLEKTGDKSILEETAPFIKGEKVSFGKKETWVGIPKVAKEGSLYQHAIKALEKSFQFGKNNLPLIGAGDWNDGLNNVGKEGKGESVWLGFFLYYNLLKFIDIAEKKKDNSTKKELIKKKNILKKALNSCWDKKWFIRAFHDNKKVIGSRKNKEYKIDLIAQSWSVISGIANKDQEKKLIKSVMNLLYDKKNKTISLFAPPLTEKTKTKYGYIQGYPQYIRENGAQYTHAAIWFLEALTKAKKPELVEKILETINPIIKSNTKEKIEKYRVEPYVIPADIWKEKNHMGQGGWTWYTASSALFYKTVLENVLGIKREKNKLIIDPCIPPHWKEFEVSYQYENTTYSIKVLNKSLTGFKVKKQTINGENVKEIFLEKNGEEKEIIVTL